MSLGIYASADPSSKFSIDGAFTKPLMLVVDGAIGGSSERRLYVRNEDVLKGYSNIEITPIDGGEDLVDGSNGFQWKLIAGDQKPLREQWALVTPGDSMSLPGTLDDTSTYLPFWLQITAPEGADVTSYQSVQLQISADVTIL